MSVKYEFGCTFLIAFIIIIIKDTSRNCLSSLIIAYELRHLLVFVLFSILTLGNYVIACFLFETYVNKDFLHVLNTQLLPDDYLFFFKF